MNDIVNLENLNDIQKTWLCDLSFVDIKEEGYKKIFEEGYKKIFEEGLTIKELKKYVKNPDLPFCGDLLLGSKNLIY